MMSEYFLELLFNLLNEEGAEEINVEKVKNEMETVNYILINKNNN